MVLLGVTAVLALAITQLPLNNYVYFAGYAVLQYIVLATAWNILGGYAGYVNFGTAAFFALGAYCSVALHKLAGPPLPLLILVGGLASGALGLAMGALTLRLRGVFFSIATLALSGRAVPTCCVPRSGRAACLISNICVCSCWRWRRWRSASHGPSSARGLVTAWPPSATTRVRRRLPACRRCA